MLKCKIFLSLTAVELAVLAFFLFLFPQFLATKENFQTTQRRELVHALKLTDLSIWTEARYTRHPAMADFFSPFQDAPASFEHFPAGSILAPNQVRKFLIRK